MGRHVRLPEGGGHVKGWIKSAGAIFLLSIMLLSAAGCGKKSGTDGGTASVNAGLVSCREFEVCDPESTETSVRGTVFVFQENGNTTMKLVAELVVDDTDFGGVALYIPSELRLDDVLCSFGGDAAVQDSASGDGYVTIWATENEAAYKTAVEVARVRDARHTPIGGRGMLVLELSVDGSRLQEDTDSLDFGVEIGAEDNGSFITWGIRAATVSVPLP